MDGSRGCRLVLPPLQGGARCRCSIRFRRRPLLCQQTSRCSTRRNWPRWRSSPATAAAPSSRIGPTCASSSVDDRRCAAAAATRAHIELYRAWMEERGLAAATIDRRLSTVCGYYRFAHIDGRIGPTRPNTCADPRCIRPPSAGWTVASWPRFSTAPSGSRRPTPPWRCCWD